MYRTFLFIHVAGGSVALLSGLIAMLTKKKRGNHSITGLLYFYSMLVVGISALIVTYLKPNYFLTVIGLFSLYLTLKGRICLICYKNRNLITPMKWDVVLSYTGILTAITMFIIGFYNYKTNISLTIILSVFGTILFSNSFPDILKYRKGTIKKAGSPEWLLGHLGFMGGSYISATTAFIVNNFHINPAWILWVLPSLAGGIIMSVTNKKWRIKTGLLNQKSK